MLISNLQQPLLFTTAGNSVLYLIVSAILLSPFNLYSQQASTIGSNRQYGHSTGWKSELKLADKIDLFQDWNVKPGKGRSQAVSIDGTIYITAGSSETKDGKKIVTHQTIAMDAKNGEQIWSSTQTSAMSQEQETFGGAEATPRATPAIVGEWLITVSFTGQLLCHRRSDGEIAWAKDLADEFGAEPVQFGFSSSPVVDPARPSQFVVLAAGKSAGLFCFNAENGEVVWKTKSETCSYATPVLADFGGVRQWVVVSENEFIGVSAADGKRLWSQKLSKPELTNVPTPLVIDGKTLLMSGQGCGGTRCFEIQINKGQWAVGEKWFTGEIQFFYTNWMKLNDRIVIGCTDKYLAAIDVEDGSVLGRWRGFGNGNVASAGEKLIVLDGKGNLNILAYQDGGGSGTEAGFSVVQKFPVTQGRCWAPMSVVGDRILVRSGENLGCVSLVKSENAKPVENLIATPKFLKFKKALANNESPKGFDPVEKIFQTFESGGQGAALELYGQLRNQNKLDEAARIALAEAAVKQGLKPLAQMVIQHALEDFPNSKEIKRFSKRLK